ncbi:MAG TPA: hypothetical protein VFK02_07130 [Kofleriaceae bacterium]|nr:hypothetical protein [Kofleriaceae bacterium]
MQIVGGELRRLVVKDLGHEQPTVLLTSDRKTQDQRGQGGHSVRAADADRERTVGRRPLLPHERAELHRRDQGRLRHALLVIASDLFRLLARKMRRYADAHADRSFRDLDLPATVAVAPDQITVRVHRRAHRPIVIDAGMLDRPVSVPGGTRQRFA